MYYTEWAFETVMAHTVQYYSPIRQSPNEYMVPNAIGGGKMLFPFGTGIYVIKYCYNI